MNQLNIKIITKDDVAHEFFRVHSIQQVGDCDESTYEWTHRLCINDIHYFNNANTKEIYANGILQDPKKWNWISKDVSDPYASVDVVDLRTTKFE